MKTTINIHDKKTKLKKKYWVKGKSKFTNARFVEEGVENINQLASKLK